jgi:hypothetical protein
MYSVSHLLPNPHFFNNSNTNEDIAMKFEQGYVRCVRNEKECVCSAPNCCDMEQQSASEPGSVASGTPCILGYLFLGIPYGVKSRRLSADHISPVITTKYQQIECMVSSFCHEVDDICVLLGYDTV